MAATVIIITLLIVVPLAIICNNKRNELIKEGKIVNRDLHFAENAEIFTLTKPEDYSAVSKGVMNFDYSDIKCSLTGDKAKQTYSFKGSDWSAKLNLVEESEDKVTYRFEFNNWSERNGIPYSALAMNKLETAVEKMFIALDGGTLVSTQAVEFKTKHSFL